METTIIKIEGMHCQHCVAAVTDALTDLKGVESVAVDLDDGSATVTYDTAMVQLEVLNDAVEDQGFDVV
ncbi:MAG TPA: copper resistance protein CopZ [Coriobacteriia bacterium]|nr:copper resistance protein CopZ [Coriobacteriia bacterium]